MQYIVYALTCIVAVDGELPRGAIAKVQLPSLTASAAFIPREDAIVVVYDDGEFALLPSDPSKFANDDLRKEVYGECALSDDAQWMAVKQDKSAPITLFRLPSLEPKASFTSDGRPVAVSAGGGEVLVKSKSKAAVVSSATGKVLRESDLSRGRIEAIRWINSDSILFKHGTGSSEDDPAPMLMQYALSDAPRTRLPEDVDRQKVLGAAVDNDNRMLAVVYGRRHRYADGTALFDLRSGKYLRFLPRDMYGRDFCVAFGSTKRLLAVGGAVRPGGVTDESQSALRIYDSERGTLKAGVTFGLEPITSVRFAPDDSMFVTVNAKAEVMLWNTARFLGE